MKSKFNEKKVEVAEAVVKEETKITTHPPMIGPVAPPKVEEKTEDKPALEPESPALISGMSNKSLE